MIFAGLLLISFLLRLPLWVNPDGLNSDHAVSALQALHMLRGELSWFLWGVGYQASLEPLINAVFFLLLGYNSYAVLATSYVAYAISLWAIFSIFRRYVRKEAAGFLAFFLVLAAPPFLTGTFYPPRPWCLTAIFVGLWAADRGKYGWGCFLAFLSLYIDFFAIQFWPALLAFCAVKAWGDSDRKRALKHFVVGFLAGAVVLALTRKLGPQGGPPLGINFRYVVQNLKLEFLGMIPTLLGIPTYSAEYEALYPAWFRSPAVLVARFLAGVSPLVAIMWSFRHWKTWDRSTTLWVLFGACLCMTSLVGATLSSNLSDIHANRYLLPLVWALPFLLLPFVERTPLKRAATYFTPYFVVVFLTTQLNYGPAVSRLLIPTPTPFGTAAPEKELKKFLLAEEVRHGYATYWPSYRMTYLFNELPLIVPVDARSNRYQPYWQTVEKAPRYALIFTDKEQNYVKDSEERLKSENKKYKPFSVAGFTGFIVDRY